MNDISTTVMGIYYFGYMPSFWIRLRCLGAVPPAAIFAMFLPPKARALFPICALESVGADLFSSGALIEPGDCFLPRLQQQPGSGLLLLAHAKKNRLQNVVTP